MIYELFKLLIRFTSFPCTPPQYTASTHFTKNERERETERQSNVVIVGKNLLTIRYTQIALLFGVVYFCFCLHIRVVFIPSVKCWLLYRKLPMRVRFNRSVSLYSVASIGKLILENSGQFLVWWAVFLCGYMINAHLRCAFTFHFVVFIISRSRPS